MPLSGSQLQALAAATAHELLWNLRSVSQLEQRWKTCAATIPDEGLRAAAVSALASKRGHTDGAALFTVLLPRRTGAVLRLLVAYELIWDYLDSVHEQCPDEQNGRQLHLALVDALDVDRVPADWYRFHPSGEDGGYLARLVDACRAEAQRLPSYTQVRSALLEEAWRGQVLALNHLTEPGCRDTALRGWAAEEFPLEDAFAWYELSGAASASLVVHMLFVLAGIPGTTSAEVEQMRAAYWPWLSLTGTMLDSYVDAAEDVRNGDHSYVAHYPSMEAAVERIAEIIGRSAANVRELPNGHRHTVILACMIAMYLSKDSANTAEFRASTRKLIEAGGSLTRVLVPVLRLWRIRYRHQSA